MTTRGRLNICISRELKDQLAVLAQHRHVAMADIVETAIREALAPQAEPETLLLRRLDRLQRDLHALQHAVEVLEETLGLFVNVYLSTTPEVPAGQEEEARRIGARRFARFLKILEGQLTKKHRLFADATTQGEGYVHAGD